MSGHGWTPERLDLLPAGTVIETSYGEGLPSFLEVKYVEGRWATGESKATSRDIADDAVSIEVYSLPISAFLDVMSVTAAMEEMAVTVGPHVELGAVRKALKAAVDFVPGVTP